LRIAVVDNDSSVRAALKRLFVACGHDVRVYAAAEELLDRRDVVEADCFLLDLSLPRMSGLELAERIRANGSLVPIVLMSGHGTAHTGMAVTGTGLPVLLKPFGEEEFLAAIAGWRERAEP
jgi:FixJ family two-component response regulator